MFFGWYGYKWSYHMPLTISDSGDSTLNLGNGSTEQEKAGSLICPVFFVIVNILWP